MKKHVIKRVWNHFVKSVEFSAACAILFLAPFIFSGCRANVEAGLRVPKIYQCEDFEFSVPIEAVDAETNGKKNGGTHFHSAADDSEVLYSFENFASEQAAREFYLNKTYKFQNDPNRLSFDLVRIRKLSDQSGETAPEKVLYIHTDLKYYLLWRNKTKVHSISSDSLKAVEEIEKDCNL